MPTFPRFDRVCRCDEIATARVKRVNAEGLAVEVWDAFLKGVIPTGELLSNTDGSAVVLEPEDDLLAIVLKVEDERLVLSMKALQRLPAWSRLAHLHEQDAVVRGAVIEVRPGGLIVDIGLPAFIPASLVELRRVRDLQPYLGQTLEARITEFDARRNTIVLSRRSWLEEIRRPEREAFLATLTPGDLRPGVVSAVTKTGIFIDLGVMDGAIMATDTLQGLPPLQVGEQVHVRVLRVDVDRERLSLALVDDAS